MPRQDWLVVGVSGATCSGKTTIANQLVSAFTRARIVQQDEFFLLEGDAKHTRIPELNHTNYEILSSIDMASFRGRIKEVLNSVPAPGEGLAVLVVEGFLILNDPEVRDLCDIKVFFTLNKETCWARRKTRTYDPPDVPGYFDGYVWPYYLKHLEQVRGDVPGIVYLDGANTVSANFTSVKERVLSSMS